jgi:hypothetical protein
MQTNFSKSTSKKIAVLLTTLITVIVLSACQPTTRVGWRFKSCQVPIYGDTSVQGVNHGVTPYLQELTALSGVKFIPSSQAEADKGGVIIKNIGGNGRTANISYSWNGTDTTTTLRDADIFFHGNPPPALVRHELGHVFGLEHHESSPVMAHIVHSANSTWNQIERDLIADVGQRTGCIK